MSKTSIFGAGLLTLLVVGLLTVWGVNNSLASKEQAVRAAKSQVDSQLKRRADLLDNLVETVKGYAGHESSTLTNVIAARNSGNMKSGQVISALAEAYPNLKAERRFADLQRQIEGTENRLAVARQDHIRRIQSYNTSLALFPASFVNRAMLGYQATAEYAVDEADTARPKVNFSQAKN